MSLGKDCFPTGAGSVLGQPETERREEMENHDEEEKKKSAKGKLFTQRALSPQPFSPLRSLCGAEAVRMGHFSIIFPFSAVLFCRSNGNWGGGVGNCDTTACSNLFTTQTSNGIFFFRLELVSLGFVESFNVAEGKNGPQLH